MKRLYATLKLFLGCSIGIFLGRCIYLYFDFKARPDLYAMQSAPWYVDLEIQGIVTAVLAAVLLAGMWLGRKKIDKKGHRQADEISGQCSCPDADTNSVTAGSRYR